MRPCDKPPRFLSPIFSHTHALPPSLLLASVPLAQLGDREKFEQFDRKAPRFGRVASKARGSRRAPEEELSGATLVLVVSLFLILFISIGYLLIKVLSPPSDPAASASSA